MTNLINVTGEINYEASETFIQKMLELSMEDTKEPIWVLIDSTGGHVDAAFLMLDAMRGCPRPVKTCCIGRAYSAAGMLLAAGTAGRYSLQHGRMLLHQPRLINTSDCSVNRLTALSVSLQNQISAFDEVISECTGLSTESAEQELSYEHYFTVKEALEFNLIDAVVDLSDIVKGK
jgi:ATP-dependent Clp protease protease subunit